MISEVDIKDMQPLYELPRGSKFKFIDSTLNDDVFTLKNIDGMYSYCTNALGTVFHFAAWTEVVCLNEE